MEGACVDEDTLVLNQLWQRKQPQFTCLPDVASEKIGGQVLYATEDQFNSKEDLLKQAEPVWHREEISNYRQKMDGWQTRNQFHSTAADFCQSCIIKLGKVSLLYGVDIDTAYFTGNYAPYISIQGHCCNSEKGLPNMVFTSHKAVSIVTQKWETVLHKTRLKAGYLATRHNYFHIKTNRLYNYLRINIYPGGGIARLRVYGTVYPDLSISRSSNVHSLDLVSLENGGHCVNLSKLCPERVKHIIEPSLQDKTVNNQTLVSHGPRRMKIDNESMPDQDWCIFKLGQPGMIKSIDLVTDGSRRALNEFCRIDGCYVKQADPCDPFCLADGQLVWIPLLCRSELQPNNKHRFSDLHCQTVLSHVKLYLSPESNVSQLRLSGYRQSTLSSKL